MNAINICALRDLKTESKITLFIFIDSIFEFRFAIFRENH